MTPEYWDPGDWRGPNTLKNRSATVSSPYKRVKSAAYCSPISLCSAYGDSGAGHSPSCFGKVRDSP